MVTYVAVAIGGFVGAILRFLISEWLGTVHGFPLSTLLINLSGSFVLTWLYIITVERVRIHPALRTGIGTGVIGAFTTFSTFSVESWKLVHAGQYVFAIIYVFVSLVGGLGFAYFGYLIAMKQSQLPAS